MGCEGDQGPEGAVARSYAAVVSAREAADSITNSIDIYCFQAQIGNP